MKQNQQKVPLWQRITSSILLPVLFTHMAFPVYATVKQHAAIESVTAAVSSSMRYKLEENVNQYLYQSALTSDELAVFDGFGFSSTR
ncbi:hypothetical protein P4S72_11215 [Vibrio sp. PP-XX7]